MGEPKVTKTRKSYYDIGICVVVVEDKVRDLLRKIVANELSKKDQAGWLALLPTIREGHSKSYQSYKVLTYLVAKSENFQQLPSETKQVQRQPSETKQVQQQSSETQQVQQQPSETQQVQQQPSKTQQVQQQPSKTQQVQQLPSETQQVQQLPSKTQQVQQLPSETQQVQQLPSETENEFLKEFKNMIGRFKMTSECDARSVNEMLNYLKIDSQAYTNLIQVLIEKFTRDIQAKATDLNNFLGREMGNEWRPLGENCFDKVNGAQMSEQHDDCKEWGYCKYRYQMKDESKGQWDWVDGMNYIRNGVVHRSFEFNQQYQETGFRKKYEKFIKGVHIQARFSLLDQAIKKEEEYMECMSVHDVVKGEVGRRKDDVERLSEENRKPEDECHSTMGGNSDLMNGSKWWEADGYSEDHDDKCSDKASHVEEMYHEKRDKTKIKNWNPCDT